MKLLPVIFVFVAGGLAACEGNAEETPAKTAEEVPQEGPPLQGLVAKKMRTVVVDEAQVARGRELFVNCLACHGEAGQGRLGLGPRLKSETFLAAASDEMLVNIITNGRAGGPR